MESKRLNLFIGDRSFAQHWYLKFKELSTERKYQVESYRLHSDSTKLLFITTIIISSLLYFLGTVNLQILLASLFILIFSVLLRPLLLKRVVLELLCYLWQSIFFHKGSLPECFGAFVPSLFLNFFLLKNWPQSLFFFCLEGFVLNTLNPDCKLNIALSILTFTVFISSLEKDFRDLWHLYCSFKKSNCLNQALWDNFPGAELIVSKDGDILYHNNCAKGLLSKLNLPQSVLKGGKFTEYFTDFKDTAQKLMTQSIKGELHEEIYMIKYKDEKNQVKEASFLITSNLFTWISGNSSRIICIDVTTHISRKQLILGCFREIDLNLKQLLGLLFHSLSESKPVSQEILALFYRTNANFKGIEAIQSHFSGEIHVKTENFDLNTELVNTIEVLYIKTSIRNLTIFYTREQAVPAIIVGDKSLHNLILFSLFDYIIINAIEGTEVYILVQVALAGADEIAISYKFSFRSDKITNSDIEELITTRKTGSNVKDIVEMQQICNKFGIGLASFDSILLAIRGYLIPVNKEIDPSKVVINICIPFSVGSGQIKPVQIKISKSCIHETPLTVKWKPDQNMYLQVHSTSEESGSDAAPLINHRTKLNKNAIQFCENIKILPFTSQIQQFLNNSIYDLDIGEESDASAKMQTYIFSPLIKKSQVYKPLLALIQSKIPEVLKEPENIELNEVVLNLNLVNNLILIDENKENFRSLGNPENFKENILWAENRFKGLEICIRLLEAKKKVTAIMFGVDKKEDKGFIDEIKGIENRFGVSVSLCGLSGVAGDLNYCKSIGVRNFSKDYLVVKPISYGQVCALVKKLELNF